MSKDYRFYIRFCAPAEHQTLRWMGMGWRILSPDLLGWDNFTPASKIQHMLEISYCILVLAGGNPWSIMAKRGHITRTTHKANNNSASNGNHYHETAQPWQKPYKIYENSNNGNVVFDKVVNGSQIMGEVLSYSTGWDWYNGISQCFPPLISTNSN